MSRGVLRLLVVGGERDPAQPWAVLAVIVPAVFLLALLVAALPAWGSTRRAPADALRAE